MQTTDPLPLLSVVVPVYNVAPYLHRCLDSLAAQTRSIDELIVVDDGSTDDCPRILADYASRLPQMRVIRQENRGLSAARNVGLANASGEYLAFVDSDDFIAPEMYERLLALAQNDQLDMTLCNANYHYEGRNPDRPVYTDAQPTPILTGQEWMRDRLARGRLMHMVWMHLYRRDFLVRNRMSFVQGLIHEDVLWTTEVLLAAKRVRYDATPYYQYRIPIRHFTPENNRRRLDAIIRSSIFNAEGLLKLAGDASFDKKLQRLLRWHAVDGGFSVFHKIGRIKDVEWQQARYRDVYRSGLFSLLWRNAGDWRQRRKVARNFAKCLFAGGLRD